MDTSVYLPDNVHLDKMNSFKLQEKKYRFYENHKTDFSAIVDLTKADSPLISHHGFSAIKLPSHPHLSAYKLDFPSGVYIIKNAVSIKQQLDVALNCMNSFVHRPYRTNLFIYEENPDWKTTYNPGTKEDDSSSFSYPSSSISKKQQAYPANKFHVNDFKKFNFNKKIRWSNVGAQYDWDKREYPAFTTPMPDIINDLCSLAKDLLHSEIEGLDAYTPQAVIVNYYDKKNNMNGHLDDGEADQKSPIFSFALGSSCVFLMGDKTKDFSPVPIQLDSGDLMVMAGYARNCYHGVPRIMENSFDKHTFEEFVRETFPDLYNADHIN